MDCLTSVTVLIDVGSVCGGSATARIRQSGTHVRGLYITAAVTEDYDLLLASITPHSRAYIVAEGIHVAVLSFGDDPDMKKLLTKHGVRLNSESRLNPNYNIRADADEAEKKAFVEFILKMENPAQFLRDFDEFQMNKLPAGAREPKQGRKPTNLHPYTDHLIRGTSRYPNRQPRRESNREVFAIGEAVFPWHVRPVEFRQIAERWYVKYPW